MKSSSVPMRLLYAAAVLVLVAMACSMFNANPATEPAAPGEPTDTPEPGVPGETPVEVATETPTATVPIVHTLVPGEVPGSWQSEITDWDSSTTAAQKRTAGGETFPNDRYERPFNATTMDIYYPDLDIKRARLHVDSTWVYVTLQLVGVGSGGSLSGNYGAEVDLNIDGRGDVLVLASNPQASWSTDGVRAWLDNNHDVGGAHPILSDAPVHGDGYETLVFDQGQGADPDAAWARVSPSDPAIVQVAFKKSLISNDAMFTWGGWVDKGVFNPAWYDYNDYFTHNDAGSPLTELSQYPIKALFELDNTCRWGVGFTPTGSEPGVCPVPPTPTPIVPGTISGVVFYDGVNGDLVLDGASMRLAGANVRVRSGSCGSPGSVVTNGTTNGSGAYTVSVQPGTYCVDVSPDPVSYSDKTPPQTVTVGNGENKSNINFGYSSYLGR